MWNKKEKKTEQKKLVSTTTTRYTSQVSQTLSVSTSEHRTRSISIGGTNNITNSFSPSVSMPRLNDSNLLSSISSTPNRYSSVNAQPLTPPKNINLNYQSPYRNSPAYSSFQNRPKPLSTATSTAYRRELPAVVTSITAPPNEKKLKVIKTNRFYDQSQTIPTYSTHGKNRGEVLVINNIMFKDKGYRHGAQVDHQNLQTLFKDMGFKVTLEKDLKMMKMCSKVKEFSKKSSLKNSDIMIVVIMSHGTKNETVGGTELFGLDEQGVLAEDLLEFFNERDCKQMANKPKIFIFQCCRGDNEQFIESDSQRVPSKIPALTNALIAYSTLPGFLSHRDPEQGTWYISALCEVFSQHAHEYHVEDLLKMVDVKVSSGNRSVKQTTHYENRGFKRCYLHPV